jgi:hypothetical protein
MRTITARTSTGKHEIVTPESWAETSVEQYQKIIGEWDKTDFCQLFGILTGMDRITVSESVDTKLASALYEVIEYVYADIDWDRLPVPETLQLRPIFAKDIDGVPVTVNIPKGIGPLSIGQAIQSRQSLEGFKDIREGISIVTAIYLQPIIDKGPFDMLRVIPLEQLILKMPITKIYPIGFFLLTRLKTFGKKPASLWNLIRHFLLTLKGKNYRTW